MRRGMFPKMACRDVLYLPKVRPLVVGIRPLPMRENVSAARAT